MAEDLTAEMEKSLILRVYLSGSSFFEGKPVHEQIVKQANRLQLASAVVYRGIMGFDKYHHLHTETGFHLGDTLPLMLEIVGKEEAVKALYPYLKKVDGIGAAAVSDANMIKL